MKSTKKVFLGTAIIAGALFFPESPKAFAALNDCSIKAVMTDANNQVLTESFSYKIQFFSQEVATSGETALDTVQVGEATPNAEGLVDINFGCPVSLFLHQENVYAALTVNDVEQTPRIPIGSVPASTIAQMALGLADGVTLSSSQIAPGSIGTTHIASGAVGSSQIASGAVGASQIAAGAVGNSQLATGAVTASKIASGSISSSHIAVTGVSSGTYGSASTVPQVTVNAQGQVTSVVEVPVSAGGGTSGPAGGSLTGTYPNPSLAANSVGSSQIADNAVGNTEIANSAVTATKIASGSISSTHLATTGVTSGTYGSTSTVPQVTVNAQGQVTSVSNVAISVAPSGTAGGSLTGTYPNPTLANNSVGSSQIIDSAVGNTKIADGSVTDTKLASGSVTATKIASASISSTHLATTGVTSGTYGSTSTVPQVTVNAQGQVTGVSNVAISVAPSGTAGGSLTGTYPNPTLANNSVGSSQIADNAVGNTEIADNAVTLTELADDSVNSAKIVDGSIQGNDISAAAISGYNLSSTQSLPGSLDFTLSGTNTLSVKRSSGTGNIFVVSDTTISGMSPTDPSPFSIDYLGNVTTGDTLTVRGSTESIGAIHTQGNLSVDGTSTVHDVVSTGSIVATTQITSFGGIGVLGKLSAGGMVNYNPERIDINNNGISSSPASGTVTPTRSHVELSCQDPDGCDVALGTTGIFKGDIVTLVNIGPNPFTVHDSGSVNIQGDFVAGVDDVLSLFYIRSHWVEVSRADN